MEKIFHANGNYKKVRIALPIWDKIIFKAKLQRKDQYKDKRVNTRGYYKAFDFVIKTDTRELKKNKQTKKYNE